MESVYIYLFIYFLSLWIIHFYLKSENWNFFLSSLTVAFSFLKHIYFQHMGLQEERDNCSGMLSLQTFESGLTEESDVVL